MIGLFGIFRTERRDAFEAGHYCHNLQTLARHEMAEACRLIRMNRLSQLNPAMVSVRADQAKRHTREALAVRSEALMILRSMRDRDGFRQGWEAAA